MKIRQNKPRDRLHSACPPFRMSYHLHKIKMVEGFQRMNIDNAMLINGGTMILAIGGLALAMGQKAVFFILATVGLTAYGIVLYRRFKR